MRVGVGQDADVGERVAVDDDEVGALALLERADLALERRRHSAAQPVAAWMACIGVRPAATSSGSSPRWADGRGRRRRCRRRPSRPAASARWMLSTVVLAQRAGALAHVRGLRLAVVHVDEQRRRRRRCRARPSSGSARGPRRGSSRARSSPRRPRAPAAGPGRRARGTSPCGRARAPRRPARASRRDRRRGRCGPWPARERGAAGRRALDDVGAGPDHRAHDAPHLGHAVGHARPAARGRAAPGTRDRTGSRDRRCRRWAR